MVDQLNWKADYLLACPLIDEQHEELIQLARELHEHFDQFEPTELAERFAYMRAYTHYHLRLEELVMERTDYPDRAAHIANHNDFSARIKQLGERFEAGDKGAADEAALLLYNWLTEHILVVDRHLITFLRDALPKDELKALMEQAYSELSLY